MFEVFDHTADVGLRVRAASLDELFHDAAQAFFSILVANPVEIRTSERRTVRLSGESLEYLLLDWLNELLYLFEHERLLFSTFSVHVSELNLEAVCQGEPIDFARHRMEHEVKAITYHRLRVEREGDHWVAEVILDI